MIAGILAPIAIHALTVALHWILPAREVRGYVRERYRLNGLRVLTAVLLLGAAAVRLDWIAGDFLWTHRFEGLAGACAAGLAFTLAMVLPARPTSKGLFADLYLGRLENPQWKRLDAKMALYLCGAVLLELNVLSFAAHQAVAFGWISTGLLVYSALLSFFVVDYLFFEEVHLYTYDFVAERVGFKLGWGCLAFYPYFYCVGAWSEAGRPPRDAPAWLYALAGAIFAAGWALSRGANLQKYWFKRDRAKKAFGLIAPEVIADGDRALLCSGFWRLSRHVNYLGEILMAIGLTLALGRPLDLIPWLYPIYYLALLIPRQRDDDARCAAKYGPLWVEYCKRVRWRIVPCVY